jgi:hypothetical protein
MKIIGRRKFNGGSVILLNNGNAQRQMRHKIKGSGVSNEMLEEIETNHSNINNGNHGNHGNNGRKGITPDIVRKFEGLKFKGKPKKYIDFNF